MNPEPLKLEDIAKALNVSRSRVVALRKQGMPDHTGVTLEEIMAWRDARDTENDGGGQSSHQEPVPAVDPSAATMTLDDRIARQKILVAEAEAVWRGSMGSRNSNSSKFQTAYNQSLKTLVALEREAFERKVKAGEFVRRSDSEAVCLSIAQLFINATDSAPDSLAALCNPDNPEKARKVIEQWGLETRKALSLKVAAMAKGGDGGQA